MKKIICTLMLLFAASTFYTCSNDDPVTNNNGNTGGTASSLSGEWTVDKVQMVEAPSNSTGSSLMKQALVPFGEVDASFAGYLDFTIGAEILSATNMNINLDYSDLYFIGNTGYRLSSSSTIEVTSDGGITWNSLAIPLSPVTGYVYDESTVFIIAYNTFGYALIKSSNSGASWDTINSNLGFIPQSGGWNSILCFVSDLTGYAITYDGKFYKTSDGGINWNNIFNWSSSTYNRSLKFFNELTGVILGDNTCRKTIDGGISWNEYSIISSGYIYSWFFLNSNTGWAGGYDNLLLKTNNGGQTWTQISDLNSCFQIKFVNENEGYCLGGEFLLKTSNSGVNWQNKYALPTSVSISQLHMINGEPAAFTNTQVLKPTGLIDTTKWVATGKITNSAVQSITHAPNSDGYANGEFTTISNNIIFTSFNYSGGSDGAVGVGTYGFDSGFLNIILNLPNNEKWKVKLRKK